jgi:hypothetical protein
MLSVLPAAAEHTFGDVFSSKPVSERSEYSSPAERHTPTAPAKAPIEAHPADESLVLERRWTTDPISHRPDVQVNNLRQHTHRKQAALA